MKTILTSVVAFMTLFAPSALGFECTTYYIYCSTIGAPACGGFVAAIVSSTTPSTSPHPTGNSCYSNGCAVYADELSVLISYTDCNGNPQNTYAYTCCG
mgnify:CR=1 FL=1